MRKRWKWLAALVTIVVVAAGLFWFLDSGMRIDPRRYRAIRIGMNRSEVETLLGAPPGDYGMRTGKHRIHWPLEGKPRDEDYKPYKPHRWEHNDTSIQVWFDDDQRVCAKALQIVRNGDYVDRFWDWIDPPMEGFAWLPNQKVN